MKQGILVKQAAMHPLSLVDSLAKNFVQEDFILANNYDNLDVLAFRMNNLSRLPAGLTRPVYTIFAGGDCAFIVAMKENSSLLKPVAAGAAEVKERDLKILKEVIFQGLLDLHPEQQDDFIITDDIKSALQSVDQGQYQYLFILNN
ncbi:hypothetical protein Desca_1768 [Desulfotomaculum nigrificans CO-1-SRB]|uniref:Uncharacterized protein n=1 Tax=Desulfotomaculum nigrificans (strain DSM 14880 / VKM B-2319 / CO-1-SRB) TaxID=868595 RepID=F6B7X8_DESCC|nr:hypothetical protein [Desulfotomaculum nigrificans]AEF94615.1 hypothetical protein Desca_1768 [Desulfotomaculum nigrificans CO-1-SRB]